MLDVFVSHDVPAGSESTILLHFYQQIGKPPHGLMKKAVNTHWSDLLAPGLTMLHRRSWKQQLYLLTLQLSAPFMRFIGPCLNKCMKLVGLRLWNLSEVQQPNHSTALFIKARSLCWINSLMTEKYDLITHAWSHQNCEWMNEFPVSLWFLFTAPDGLLAWT